MRREDAVSKLGFEAPFTGRATTQKMLWSRLFLLGGVTRCLCTDHILALGERAASSHCAENVQYYWRCSLIPASSLIKMEPFFTACFPMCMKMPFFRSRAQGKEGFLYTKEGEERKPLRNAFTGVQPQASHQCQTDWHFPYRGILIPCWVKRNVLSQ